MLAKSRSLSGGDTARWTAKNLSDRKTATLVLKCGGSDEFSEVLDCHRLVLPEKPGSNVSGTYFPQEHLDRTDRWRVTLSNPYDRPAIARLMFMQQRRLPITGFTPT